MNRTINNIAYLIPILTNVLLGRRTMHRGPFFMGNLAGMSVNIITVAWLVFAIVFFSFPYKMPVKGSFPSLVPFSPSGCRSVSFIGIRIRCGLIPTASNMNYTCACVGGFLVIEIIWWFVSGRKYSRTMKKAREEDANAARTMMASTGDK